MIGSAADADFDVVLKEAQHKESHSTHQEHLEGTNDCSLGTYVAISFLLEIGVASYTSRDARPS